MKLSWKPKRDALHSPPTLLEPSIFSKSVKSIFEYLKEAGTYWSHITSDLALMEKLVKSPRESTYIPKWTQGCCCPNHWRGEETVLRKVSLFGTPWFNTGNKIRVHYTWIYKTWCDKYVKNVKRIPFLYP